MTTTEKEYLEKFLDKACVWLKENYINSCGSICTQGTNITFYQDSAIEKFREAMLDTWVNVEAQREEQKLIELIESI